MNWTSEKSSLVELECATTPPSQTVVAMLEPVLKTNRARFESSCLCARVLPHSDGAERVPNAKVHKRLWGQPEQAPKVALLSSATAAQCEWRLAARPRGSTKEANLQDCGSVCCYGRSSLEKIWAHKLPLASRSKRSP